MRFYSLKSIFKNSNIHILPTIYNRIIQKSDNMTEKTFLYEWTGEDFKNLTPIERKTFRKADDLNDKILDLKILLDEINEDWDEYMQFLEDERISKLCEFHCQECIEFDEELLRAIGTTLKKSLNDVNKSISYNTKKIKINQVVDG